MRKKLSELTEVDLRSLAKNEEVSHDVAAAYCRLSPGTLYNKINSGRGPRSLRRFGRRVYVISDLDLWLNNETLVKKAYA
jgi:hypothetical protein